MKQGLLAVAERSSTITRVLPKSSHDALATSPARGAVTSEDLLTPQFIGTEWWDYQESNLEKRIHRRSANDTPSSCMARRPPKTIPHAATSARKMPGSKVAVNVKPSTSPPRLGGKTIRIRIRHTASTPRPQTNGPSATGEHQARLSIRRSATPAKTTVISVKIMGVTSSV